MEDGIRISEDAGLYRPLTDGYTNASDDSRLKQLGYRQELSRSLSYALPHYSPPLLFPLPFLSFHIHLRSILPFIHFHLRFISICIQNFGQGLILAQLRLLLALGKEGRKVELFKSVLLKHF